MWSMRRAISSVSCNMRKQRKKKVISLSVGVVVGRMLEVMVATKNSAVDITTTEHLTAIVVVVLLRGGGGGGGNRWKCVIVSKDDVDDSTQDTHMYHESQTDSLL